METTTGNVSIGSLHTSNERAKKIKLWEWLHNFLHDGNWVLVGVWNMAELHENLVGPSPRLHGTEEWSWKRTIDAIDGVDLYLTTVSRKGPIYMR